LSQVLTGLYEEQSKLRKARAAYNSQADEYMSQYGVCMKEQDTVSAETCYSNAKNCKEQAAVYTPYIRKFKKKIAAVEEIQRMLKDELKDQQSLEAWIVEDDAFWLQQAYVARQEGYNVTYSFDEAAKLFGEE
jgi:acetyl-CoA acetyltransferase